MDKLQLREAQTLKALSQMTEPARASDLTELTGLLAMAIGNSLRILAKGSLAELVDKKKKFWRITDSGKELAATLPALEPKPPATPPATPPALEPKPPVTPPTTPPTVVASKPTLETREAIPSQSDIFRREGELLGIGVKKGEIQLDTIVAWVQRTANLNDLSSVWNALTEMNVANDVKKRWIKLYSQNLPSAEITPELKVKLEAGTEAEIVIEKEEAPRAKKFNVIAGQIMPDPEGEYSFSQAIQKAMVEKGASSNQAAEMATTFAKMNTDTLNTLIPIITRDPPKTDNTVIQILQQRIEQLADDKHKAEMESLRTEMRSGQRSPESSQEIQALSQQIDNLRDQLHNEQLARIQEQNTAQVKELSNSLKRLEQQLARASEGKQVESRIGLMSKALDAGAEELKGIRADIKPLAQTFIERRAAPSEKTAVEKADFAAGLVKGIERAHEATELENELFFGKGS